MYYAVRYLETEGTFSTKMPVQGTNPSEAVRKVIDDTDRQLDTVFVLATDENGRPQSYSKSDLEGW